MTPDPTPRCETCDFHGPELPTAARDLRELHRALHGFTDALIGPTADWQMLVLAKAMDACGKRVRLRLVLPRRKWRSW